jgi:hypothetical protein
MTDLVPLDERRLSLIERQAAVAARSGLVPTDNPDAAAYIMLRAAGFGLDPLTAFEHFHLIDTKAGPKLIVSSMFLGGMARSKGARIEWLGSDHQQATCRLRRPGEQTWTSLTVTIADARTAGLATKDVWQKYPAAMLRAWCQRQLVRMAMPDVLLGLPAADDVDLEAEFVDELASDDEGDAEPEVVGEVDPGPAPQTWRAPPVDDRVRAMLVERVAHLPVPVAAAVRDIARNVGMPKLSGPHFTRADGALLHRLIDEAEQEQDAIDTGFPVPAEVHDNQPEANRTEEGSEKYDPADGEPFL